MAIRELLTREIGPSRDHPVMRLLSSGGAYMVLAAGLMAMGMLLMPFGPGSIWSTGALLDEAAGWSATSAAARTFVAQTAFLFAAMALLGSGCMAAGSVFEWEERRRGLAGLALIAAAALIGAAALIPMQFLGATAEGQVAGGLGGMERFGFAANLFVLVVPTANLILWMGVSILTEAAAKERVISRGAATVGGVFCGLAGITPLIAVAVPFPASWGPSAAALVIMLPALGWLVLLGVTLGGRELRPPP